MLPSNSTPLRSRNVTAPESDIRGDSVVGAGVGGTGVAVGAWVVGGGGVGGGGVGSDAGREGAAGALGRLEASGLGSAAGLVPPGALEPGAGRVAAEAL